MESVTWDDLRLPKIETDEDLDRRLKALYDDDEVSMTVDGRLTSVAKNSGYAPTKVHAKIIGAFSALGVGEMEIADIMSIPLDVLRRYYKRELTISPSLANAAVAQVALDMATSGQSAEMTKFWLKTRAGWRDAPKSIEISGPGGGPIELDSAKAKLANVLNIDPETGDVIR